MELYHFFYKKIWDNLFNQNKFRNTKYKESKNRKNIRRNEMGFVELEAVIWICILFFITLSIHQLKKTTINKNNQQEKEFINEWNNIK